MDRSLDREFGVSVVVALALAIAVKVVMPVATTAGIEMAQIQAQTELSAQPDPSWLVWPELVDRRIRKSTTSVKRLTNSIGASMQGWLGTSREGASHAPNTHNCGYRGSGLCRYRQIGRSAAHGCRRRHLDTSHDIDLRPANPVFRGATAAGRRDTAALAGVRRQRNAGRSPQRPAFGRDLPSLKRLFVIRVTAGATAAA